MNRRTAIRKALAVCSIITSIILLNTSCWAGTYYVDANLGNNSYNGSSSSPWKELPGTLNATTPTTGWTMVQPGDTIILTAGQSWAKPVLVNSYYYKNPPDESGRITIKSSSSSNRAIFDFSSSGTSAPSAAFNIRLDYISLEYLEICNMKKSGSVVGVYIGNADANDYVNVKYCYIHDIIDTNVLPTENYSYAVGIVWSTGSEIAYNTFKNIDKKFISTSEIYSNSLSIHHNVMYNEADFTGDPMDHGIVLSGNNHLCYNNILWNNHSYYGEGYAIKTAGAGGSASNSKIYNNIILKWNGGIGLLDSNGPQCINNTIYLAASPPINSYTASPEYNSNVGISLRNTSNAVVRNNIVYYPKVVTAENKVSGAQVLQVAPASTSTSNNTITNNVFFSDGSTEKVGIRGGDTDFFDLSWIETRGNWNGVNGNICEGNTIASPGFSGGSHPISNLPSGFDSDWVPNNPGISLSGSSAAIDKGNAVMEPYNMDVRGVPRPRGNGPDMGAYEYGDASSPEVPRNLKVLDP